MRVACTVVRTDTVPSESVEVNVGLHQSSVLLLSCFESPFTYCARNSVCLNSPSIVFSNLTITATNH